jgi:hypothetical protein
MKIIPPFLLGVLMLSLFTTPLRAEVVESNGVIQLKVYDQSDELSNGDMRAQSYPIMAYNTAKIAQFFANKKGEIASEKARM